MNLSAVLNIAQNGLTAATNGQAVTSQNISNATTDGYTRKITNTEAIPLSLGGGAVAGASTRVQDSFLERRSLSARSANGEASARAQTLQVLDQDLTGGDGSVAAALDGFESAMADFSNNPSQTATRQVVLQKADELAQAFNRTSADLTQARVDANGQISSQVQQLDSKLTQIGSLNAQIVAARNQGKESGDLEDQRDQLIRDVSTMVPVSSLPDQSGAITLVMAGSRTLVSADGTVHPLQASIDATSGDIHIYRTTAGAQEDLTSLITTGSIGGTIAARDGALKDARDQLDQLASNITSSYNTVHAAGYGLDGINNRNLFTPEASVAGAAAAFSVSSDVAGQPSHLAAATDPTMLPGDNRNALALNALEDQKVAFGGTQTAQDAYTSIMSSAATAVASAKDQQTQTDNALTQVDALRESASGVSSDEEMVSLMKFQRAYQASLRVIETADAMLGDLLNMPPPGTTG